MIKWIVSSMGMRKFLWGGDGDEIVRMGWGWERIYGWGMEQFTMSLLLTHAVHYTPQQC